jgi:hypothetical protein
MARERHNYVIVVAVTILQFCFKESNGKGLEAKLAGGKLPTALYYSTAVYDGNDSVYLFGG